MLLDAEAAVDAGAPRQVRSPRVRHMRQILLWPLRLLPTEDGDTAHRAPWHLLRELGDRSPWREVIDEYTGDREDFHERHYNEFVAFLPVVQRFLYGEGRSRRGVEDPEQRSPMRVFRRRDVSAVRIVPRPGDAPITLQIAHLDLYFFYDVDIVLLNVEVSADDLSLDQAQELLYRFGRAYPPGWDARGHPLHCPHELEWLGHDGTVLTRSDARERDAFLAHLCEHRAPRVNAHWSWVLEPLVSHHSDAPGALRYRQIEYYRMPMMAYLALDDPRALDRADFVRLALVTGGDGDAHDGRHLADFETRYCYDRFWRDGGMAPNTRYLCNGHALVVIGEAGSNFYACRDRGVLAQFRHQHFMLFLIAHFQRATLLMFSDRLVEALRGLDVTRPSSIKHFKRQIREGFEQFLRFTHRYWFHEVSDQAQVRALFEMCARHLGLDGLYREVKERIADMNAYLDADSIRRQANTVVRLTVVTIFGLIGSVTTGFLGMNLLAEADAPLERKLWIFAVVIAVTAGLTVYTIAKSKRLSDFLDAVSDDRLSPWAKLKSLAAVWLPIGREG